MLIYPNPKVLDQTVNLIPIREEAKENAADMLAQMKINPLRSLLSVGRSLKSKEKKPIDELQVYIIL